MRVNSTGAELDELSVHGVVNTGCVTGEVWTSAFYGSFLLEIVETNIVSVVTASTAEVYIMILANTCLEHFLEPIGIGVIHELVGSISAKTVASRNRRVRVYACLPNILAILTGIHYIIHTI